MLKYLHRRERGDTIVEVIVVLAVLGMAISISYATANRSLLDARQAQEASQAAELIQGQVESLRTMANNAPLAGGSSNPDFIFPPTIMPFCLPNNGTVPYHVVAATDPACQNFNNLNLYSISIKYIGLNANGGNFIITASWDDVEGQGRDTATLTYYLYPTPKPS